MKRGRVALKHFSSVFPDFNLLLSGLAKDPSGSINSLRNLSYLKNTFITKPQWFQTQSPAGFHPGSRLITFTWPPRYK